MFASFELELQTLKKLKGKQEESKKREMSRLMNKLDAQDKAMPAMKSATENAAHREHVGDGRLQPTPPPPAANHGPYRND